MNWKKIHAFQTNVDSKTFHCFKKYSKHLKMFTTQKNIQEFVNNVHEFKNGCDIKVYEHFLNLMNKV